MARMVVEQRQALSQPEKGGSSSVGSAENCAGGQREGCQCTSFLIRLHSYLCIPRALATMQSYESKSFVKPSRNGP